MNARGGMTDQGRDLIRKSLYACDQTLLDQLVVRMVLTGAFADEDVEATLREELATAPHEVQEYWNGECNCDGRQN